MATEYIYSSALNQLFRDKDTGLPLAGGKVFFYEDSDRVTLKTVFKQTGSPGSYGYVPYETNADGSIPINSYGAFDHALFLYPFDVAGTSQLYFVEVESSVGVQQFTREGYPLIQSQTTPSTTGLRQHNYIANGQFLVHKFLAEDAPLNLGEVRAEYTDIDGADWVFHRSAESSSEDYVLFTRFDSFDAIPPNNPRYAINIRCDNEGGGSVNKDLQYRFQTVNMFSNESGQLTYAFWAKAQSPTSVDIFWAKNYGSGGSESTESSIATIDITTDWAMYTHTFTPGPNSDVTIGIEDDDYAALLLRFPTDLVFDVVMTNFLLYEGNVINPAFPSVNPIEVISNISALTSIGKIEVNASSADYGWWLLCDGRSLDRKKYYKLFQMIGTGVGTPPSETTFLIPDYRGRNILGSGQGTGLTNRTLHDTGGAESAVLTVANLPPHTHPYVTSTIGDDEGMDGNGDHTTVNRTRKNFDPAGTATGSVGSSTPVNIVNPFGVANLFIYTGEI